MSFSFLDLLLIAIFSQGFFFLIAIQLLPNKNREANRTLTVVLLIANIMLLGRVVIYHYHSPVILRLGVILDGTIYLFGPFLYCYIRRLTIKETFTYTLNWKHFIPLMVYTFYLFWTLSKSTTELKELGRSGALSIVFLIIELAGILSLAFYLIRSYRILQVFNKHQKSQISYDQHIAKYLFSILIALSIFLFIWIFSFINAYFFYRYFKYVSYDMMWISVSLLMYFIGFFSLTQPHIFRMSIKKEIIKEQAKDRLKKGEIEELQIKLKRELLQNKIYLKPDLNLIYLAEKLETTPNNLSWFLNRIYKKSFYEFINEYRVKDFVERVGENQHQKHTLFSIALEVGFNTKSTFNKSFKSVMNDTPSNYIKRLNTDL